MDKKRTFKDHFFLVIKGLAMGAANKVPGVSGGVVAFVAGFYEEFIYSLQRVNKNAFKLLFKGQFRQFYTYINGPFIGLLFLGMIISYFSVSKLLDYLIIHYELYVWSLFFGMILGSIYYISRSFKDWRKTTVIALIVGTAAGLSISFLDPATENDHLFFVFLCGIISVSGMTLPGFSGSFILILLGNYVLLLVDAVNALYDTLADIFTGDFSFLKNSIRLRLLSVLGIFTLGSVVGLVSFSHVLNYILKHYKNITLATIVGFITGSLGVVWPWKETIYKQDNSTFILDSRGEQIIENYQNSLAYNFGLIGKDIDYSFSRHYFSKKFKENGLAHSYSNFDIPTIEAFDAIIKNTPDLKGLNVTIPYKEVIIPYLDRLNKKAEKIGAVNTIKITKKKKLIGYNTDYYGFKKSLQPYLKSHHKNALILGTGGASKAIAYALNTLGISYDYVSRTKNKTASFTYSELNEDTIASSQIIINCTPLGTSPNIDAYPQIPYHAITEHHILYDLIYNPEETKFLHFGKQNNATVINGLHMLQLQAEKAWDIWN